MTEKVGGIEYEIDADASGVKAASEAVKASSTSMANDFKKVDSAVKTLIAQQVNLGRTIDANGNVISKTGKQVVGATKALKDLIARQKELKNSSDRVTDAYQKLNGATSRSAGAMGGMGRKAGMAGIQIEQFVGSVQGGQDAMRAFSFQATDLGIVLGAPLIGAAVGLGAALVSALIPSLSGTEDNVDTLIEKLEKLKETTTLNAVQSRFMAEQEKKTSGELEKSIVVMKEKLATQKELIADTERAIKQGTRLKSGAGSELEIITEKDLEKAKEGFNQLEVELDLAQTSLKNSTSAMNAYNIMGAGGTTQTEKQKESVNGLIKSLREQYETLGMNSDQLFEWNLANKEASDGQKLNARLIYEQTKKKQAGIDVDRKAKELAEQQLKTTAQVFESYQSQNAQLELNSKQLDEYNARKKLGLEIDEALPEEIQAEIDSLESLRQKRAEIAEQKAADRQLEQEYKTVQAESSDDPLTALEEELKLEREIIAAHLEMKLANKELTDEQIRALEQSHQDKLTAIDDDAAKAREAIAQAEKQAKLNALSSTFGALSSLMNTESKKLFEIGKAAAIAGAIVDGFAAVSKTMASAPYPLNIGLAAAQAVASAVQVQNIAKQKVGGAQTMGATASFSGGTPVTNTQQSGGFGDRNVSISGLDPNSLFSGQQVRDLLANFAGDGGDFTFLSAGG